MDGVVTVKGAEAVRRPGAVRVQRAKRTMMTMLSECTELNEALEGMIESDTGIIPQRRKTTRDSSKER